VKYALFWVAVVIAGVPMNIFVAKPISEWLFGEKRPVVVRCPMNMREYKDYLDAIQGIRTPAPLTWEVIKERKAQ
jgi:hypothetical protein